LCLLTAGRRGGPGVSPTVPCTAPRRTFHSHLGAFHTLSTALSTGVDNGPLTGARTGPYVGLQMRPSPARHDVRKGKASGVTVPVEGLFIAR